MSERVPPAACHGTVVLADRPLSRAAPINGTESDHFHLCHDQAVESMLRDRCVDGRFVELADGSPVRLGTTDEWGSSLIDLEAGVIRHWPATDAHEWEHILLSSVLPQAIGLHDGLVLHAAALQAPGSDRATLFIGPSGSGKSTLASVAARHGYRIISEDGVRITPRRAQGPGDGTFLCHPGLQGARLRERTSAGIERRRVQMLDPEVQVTEPIPLGAIVVMTRRGAGVTPRLLSTPEAVMAVTNHRLSLVPERASRQLTVLIDVVRANTWAASFPDSIDELPASLDELMIATGV